MQDFSTFWSQLALYTVLFYWHPQILLDNKLKLFTYTCIQLYIFIIWVPEYSIMHLCMYKHTHIYVYIYIYICIYLTVTIKSHSTPATQFFWYSTATSDYCGVVLLFIPLTNYITCTNQLTFPNSPSVQTVFNLNCVCVCVCVSVGGHGYTKST
jgi:hypothetical protein